MQDLYIGANVYFHNFKFILIDADEYAVVYMEKHATEFPQANVRFILPKLKHILDQKYEEIKGEFQAFDTENSGKIPAKNFRWIFSFFHYIFMHGFAQRFALTRKNGKKTL